MAEGKDKRSRAEEQFEKARRVAEAKSDTDREREYTRKKTERLRELRLAKEGAGGITEAGRTPKRGKTKPNL